MSKITVGWDIGGAHLKASVVDANGVAQMALQLPCPLWRGIEALKAAMQQALYQISQAGYSLEGAQHAITMTGELVDCFDNRHQGVCAIASQASEFLGSKMLVYTAGHGFVGVDVAPNHTHQIASMNWHASATWLAQQVNAALLVDMGSTTTDIIPIQENHTVKAQSDAERMANATLIYTGVSRTPLMALAQHIQFNQQKCYLAAEHFATAADVYRLLTQLPPEYDVDATADGQDKSTLSSARRVARMVGHDVEDFALSVWQELALAFKQKQQNLLQAAIETHAPVEQIVAMGQGCFVIQEIADKLGIACISIQQFIQADHAQTQTDTAVILPAYAVALLARQHVS